MKGPHVMLGRDLKGVRDRNCICVYSVMANCEGFTCHAGKGFEGVGNRICICIYSVIANCEGSTCHAGKGFEGGGRWELHLRIQRNSQL